MGHDRRDDHDPRHPVLLTLRAAAGAPSLRALGIFAAVKDAISRLDDEGFRVLHFSVQQDHVHAIVEADAHDELIRGIRSLIIRIALAIKRVAGIDRVWGDRYHARPLKTPREVRHAIAYVLLNSRKHLRAPAGVDPRSSGPWFDGWKQPPRAPKDPRPTSLARTWLGGTGWRRRGPIGLDEGPPAPVRRDDR